MKKIIYTIILITISCFIGGCFDWNNLENATIYTTVYPIQFLTTTLYQSYINADSSSIYPNGANVTEYTLTDKQEQTYSKGTLFVYNGTTNEKQIAMNLINRNKKLKIIDVAYGLKYTYGVEELWLSPSNYLMLAINFKDNLETLVGSKYVNEEIEKKYKELEENLSIMDAEMRKTATNAQNSNRQTIIASSNMFKFLENYGFTVISLEDYKNNITNINTLKNMFQSGTYKYIFKKNNEENSELINDLKENCNASIIEVDTMTTLSDKQVNSNENYFTIMKNFLSDLKTATSY